VIKFKTTFQQREEERLRCMNIIIFSRMCVLRTTLWMLYIIGLSVASTRDYDFIISHAANSNPPRGGAKNEKVK